MDRSRAPPAPPPPGRGQLDRGESTQRAEDLADVLAYHYQSALELNQAAGLGEQTEQLQAQVVRYLAMAGERALALDIEQAERQLARALELCPDDAPERACCWNGGRRPHSNKAGCRMQSRRFNGLSISTASRASP